MKIIFALCAIPLIAAAPASYKYWSAAELKGYDQKLSDGKKINTSQLATFENHSVMMAHREGNGEAELHEHVADLFVVETGAATLIVGGKMPGAKTTAPGEMRGASIEGGTKQELSAGDIVHIPANTPHQLMVNSGEKFTYFVMKVKGQ